jgi:hypothetical protein
LHEAESLPLRFGARSGIVGMARTFRGSEGRVGP